MHPPLHARTYQRSYSELAHQLPATQYSGGRFEERVRQRGAERPCSYESEAARRGQQTGLHRDVLSGAVFIGEGGSRSARSWGRVCGPSASARKVERTNKGNE